VIVCANIVIRKLKTKKIDEVLESKKDTVAHSFFITAQEQACIMRTGCPEAYVKFLQKEDWFNQLRNNVAHHFIKDKSLKSKAERAHSLWKNIYLMCKNLIEELQQLFPQTNINGMHNQWIVKPGGLSRGRNIRIFDCYAEICKYTDVPFVTAPNGL